MKYDTARPYIASYVLLEEEGKIAFVLRANTPWMNNYYGLPSGKVEQGESYLDCAIREAEEEVGVVVAREDMKFAHTAHRNHKDQDNGSWVDVYFRAEKWQGEPYNAEPGTHSELAWLDPDNLPDNVIPPTRFAIEQILAGEQYSQYGFN